MTSFEQASGAVRDIGSGSPPATYTRKATGLVREVRLADMFAFNASAMSPLSGILSLSVFVVFASFPGSNLYLDLAICAVVLPLVWVTFSLMSSAMPGVGGDYLYGSRILHPVLGLFSNLCTYGGALLSVALVAVLFNEIGLVPLLSTVGVVAHSQGWIDAATRLNTHGWTFAFGAVLVVLASVLSVVGTKFVARAMAWAYFAALGGGIIALLILLVTSRHHFVSTINDVSAPYTRTPDTYSATITAGQTAGLVYPNAGGYSGASTLGALFPLILGMNATFYGIFLAGEMKGAGKRSRQLFAQAGSGYFQLVLVVVGVLIFMHVAGYNFVAAASNGSYGVPTSPFFTFFASAITGSPVVALVLEALFLLAFAPWLYANLAMCQRVPFALAFDGLLPKRVAAVNERTHAPMFAIVATAVLSLVCTAYAAYASSFIQVVAYTGVTGLMVFVTVGLCAATIRPARSLRRQPR
jgi:amino acid transporter